MTSTRLFRSIVLLLCLIGPAGTAGAQTVTDERAWFNLALQDNGIGTSSWHWTFETILRSRDAVDKLDQLAIRPSVTYDLSSHSSVGGGYLFGRQDPAIGPNVIEHRLYGQYQWKTSAHGGSLSFRTRLEDRIIVNDSGPIARFRQQVRYSHPIAKGSPIAFVAYDELLLHLNRTNRYVRGIDHNRAFAGISATVTPRARIEIGYLNQFVPGHGGLDKMNHVVSGGLVLAF